MPERTSAVSDRTDCCTSVRSRSIWSTRAPDSCSDSRSSTGPSDTGGGRRPDHLEVPRPIRDERLRTGTGRAIWSSETAWSPPSMSYSWVARHPWGDDRPIARLGGIQGRVRIEPAP
jgi:hypothetical protein